MPSVCSSKTHKVIQSITKTRKNAAFGVFFLCMSKKMSNFALSHVYTHMKKTIIYSVILLIISLFAASPAKAADGPYLLELGLQGGINYYLGDANNIPFANPREIYGAQFRYKINRRWAMQVKGNASRIAFKAPELYENKMVSLDAVAEYNFFRFSESRNDYRNKPYTPYIFLGIGASLYDGDKNYSNVGAYLPFGVGFKWKFASYCGLIATWQHNLHFVDNLENRKEFDNVQDLNGSNFFNFDLTGNFTVGLVFDFLEAKKVCITCDWD